MRPLVFHLDHELYEYSRFCRQLQESNEVGIIKRIPVVVRVQTDPPHSMDLAATPQVLPPIRRSWIHGADRDQQAGAAIATLGRQPFVRAGNVLVQYAVEACNPRLVNLDGAQLVEELAGILEPVPAERPVSQVSVGVDRHGLTPLAVRIGVNSRFRLSLKMARFAASGTSAPCTFAICDAKLRPPASLP